MKILTNDWVRDKTTQRVCSVLSDAGYQVFFVGGCVRNALLSVPVRDIDLCTNAHPDKVINLFNSANIKVIATGIDHGTVTVISGHTPFEITTFRRDIKTDGRHAVIAFADTINKDARRRDFTMNALYAAPDGTIHDPLGGIGDLNARRVRFIEDANKRINEDYLRILRFFRFHAWYGDTDAAIDADTLAAIAVNLDGLKTLSPERVGSEIKKLLSAQDPAPSVAAMRATGVLPTILAGATDRALAPLIHLETQNDVAPNPIRRLAALGTFDVARLMRLSKAEQKQYKTLRTEIETSTAPHALGYLYGFETACDIILLRASLFEIQTDTAAIKDAAFGSKAVFPIRAADLMPTYVGPALGKRLAKLKTDWIESRFTMTKSQLLGA